MTNKELQAYLKEFPEEALIAFHAPVQGDSENAVLVHQIFVDNRFPHRLVVLSADNYSTEERHCWCGEHAECPSPEPDCCYEKIKRSGADPRPLRV